MVLIVDCIDRQNMKSGCTMKVEPDDDKIFIKGLEEAKRLCDGGFDNIETASVFDITGKLLCSLR